MINYVLCLTIMAKHYMGHRLQATVQFNMVENINNKCLKGDESRILFFVSQVKGSWNEVL